MAILKSGIEFTGSMGNVSAYKMQGTDKTVLRTKGGPSKKQILKSPKFKRTRENYTEFGQCGKMGGSIRKAMLSLVSIADYNFTPSLNALAKIIQVLDTESERGKRNVLLSKYKHYLNGFSLCKSTAFESMVRHPLTYNIDREAAEAVLQVPGLIPGVNLILPKQYPLFRFVLSLGCVDDRIFGVNDHIADHTQSRCVYSDWYHTGDSLEAAELSVKLTYPEDIQEHSTLILAVGLQMGVPLTAEIVNPVKRAGVARIFMVN